MACSWTKQPIYNGSPLNVVNDAVIGGQLSSVPVGVYANQGEQTLPGDHLVLDDAAAQSPSMSSAAVGTLFGGYYQYVLLDASATTLIKGQTLYWKLTSNTTGVYTVTNVQTGNTPAFAGVLLNPNATPGNYIWMQCFGRATVLIDAASGATSIGSSMSLSASTGTSNASLAVSTSTALGAPSLYVGISEVAVAATPTAGTTAVVDIQKVTLRF